MMRWIPSVMLIKVPVGDGTDAVIEMEADYSDLGQSVQLVSDDPDSPGLAAFSLAGSIRRVLPAINAVLGGLSATDLTPDEVSIELGLKVGGETGLVFAKGKTEATFVVKMTWRQASADSTAVPDAARPDSPDDEEGDKVDESGGA
jgi:hypothetical protein